MQLDIVDDVKDIILNQIGKSKWISRKYSPTIADPEEVFGQILRGQDLDYSGVSIRVHQIGLKYIKGVAEVYDDRGETRYVLMIDGERYKLYYDAYIVQSSSKIDGVACICKVYILSGGKCWCVHTYPTISSNIGHPDSRYDMQPGAVG